MRYTLKSYTIWEFGKRVDAEGKPHQEDMLFPLPDKIDNATDRLFMVCDGMGGHEAGEVASATVSNAISSYVKEVCPDVNAPFNRARVAEAVNCAFDDLDDLDPDNSPSRRKMGTTLAMLYLSPEGATIAHMGDSRVYHIRPGKNAASSVIVHRTVDHSLVEQLVKIGQITREEAMTHPRKNVIVRALQPHLDPRPKATIDVDTDIRPGDYFYLCSDGMLEQMDDENILNIFSKPDASDEEKVEILRQATIDNSDNHTAIIVHILDVEGEPVPMVEPEPEKDVEVEVVEGAASFMPEESHDAAMPPAAAQPAKGVAASVKDKFFRKTNRRQLMIVSITAAVLVLGIAAWFIFAPSKNHSPLVDSETLESNQSIIPMQDAETADIVDGTEAVGEDGSAIDGEMPVSETDENMNDIQDVAVKVVEKAKETPSDNGSEMSSVETKIPGVFSEGSSRD